eukprot:1146483-Pelagomonas_calceolata.AAC.4
MPRCSADLSQHVLHLDPDIIIINVCLIGDIDPCMAYLLNVYQTRTYKFTGRKKGREIAQASFLAKLCCPGATLQFVKSKKMPATIIRYPLRRRGRHGETKALSPSHCG